MRINSFLTIAVMFVLPFAGSYSAEEKTELVLYDVTELNHPILAYASSCSIQDPMRAADAVVNEGIVCSGLPRSTAPTAATLQEMIKVRINPASWDPATGHSIEEKGGILAIMQTAEIHKQIAVLLSQWREQFRPQLVVKGLLIPSATIPQDTFFTPEALAKLLGDKGMAGALAAPRVVCFNTQRVQVKCVREAGHVHDFEVSGDMLDPVVNSAIEGCVFEVRPLLADNRRSVNLELRLLLSSGLTFQNIRKIVLAPPLAPRPAEDKSTSFFQVDTPSMHTGTVLTNVRIPTGKWVLAGTFGNPNADTAEKNVLVLVSAEALGNGVDRPFRIPDLAQKKSAPVAPKEHPKVDPASLELRVFDVRDISEPVTDFSSPGANLLAEPVDAYWASSPGFADTDIAALIKEKEFVEYFTDPATSIDVSSGKLVVAQTPAMLDAIAKFIDTIREKVQPQIVVKAHLISAADVPENTFYDEDGMNAILKAEGHVTVANYRNVCLNRQQTNTRNGKAFSYVKDYDVSGSVYDPVMSAGFDGMILETRPMLSDDRATIHVDLQFENTSDVTKTKRTLGAQEGSTGPASALTIQTTQANGTSTSAQPIASCELDLITQNRSVTQTQIVVPKGKWVLTSVFSSGNPKGPKNLLLFVTAEVLETP